VKFPSHSQHNPTTKIDIGLESLPNKCMNEESSKSGTPTIALSVPVLSKLSFGVTQFSFALCRDSFHGNTSNFFS